MKVRQEMSGWMRQASGVWETAGTRMQIGVGLEVKVGVGCSVV